MLNHCTFVGNLGRDPEIRSFQSGDQVANFSIACTEKWKDKQTGERKEKTNWIPVSVFGPLVRVVESYLRKGSKVYIAGKFETRKWQDQNGNDRYSTEIILRGPGSRLVMLDGPSGDQNTGGFGGGHGSGGANMPDNPVSDRLYDDIPFYMEWRA